METPKGSFLSWKLSLAETLSFGATIAVFTLWAVNNFQSKEEAREWKAHVEAEISSVKGEVSSLRTSTNNIAVDVSYIRGRLEPKSGKGE